MQVTADAAAGGMWTRVHTTSGQSVGRFASVREAIDAAPPGAVVTLPAGSVDLGGTLHINKPLTLRGTTRVSPTFGQGVLQNLTCITGMPKDDESSMISVAQGSGMGTSSPRSGVVIERLRIRCDRVAEVKTSQREKEGIDGIRIRGGDVGTVTRVDVIDCELSHGSGGIGVELTHAGQPDNNLFVRIEGCHIHDTFPSIIALPDGRLHRATHSQGVYFAGGTITMTRCVIERIGYVRGSRIFTRTNKNQGVYGASGTFLLTDNVVSDVAHCCYQYRACIVTSIGNIADLSPMGFQFGHRQEAEQARAGRGILAVVVSERDRVRRPRPFPDRESGGPTLGCGVHFDDAGSIRVRDLVIDGDGGIFGGWGGLHLSRVNDTIIDVDGIEVRGWAKGLHCNWPLAANARHRWRRVVLRDCEPMISVPWRDEGDLTTKMGGTWEACELGPLAETLGAEMVA